MIPPRWSATFSSVIVVVMCSYKTFLFVKITLQKKPFETSNPDETQPDSEFGSSHVRTNCIKSGRGERQSGYKLTQFNTSGGR